MEEEGKKDSTTHSLTKTHRLACHSLIFLKTVYWISSGSARSKPASPELLFTCFKIHSNPSRTVAGQNTHSIWINEPVLCITSQYELWCNMCQVGRFILCSFFHVRCKTGFQHCEVILHFFSTLRATKVVAEWTEKQSWLTAAARHSATLATKGRKVKAGARETEHVRCVECPSPSYTLSQHRVNTGAASQCLAVMWVGTTDGGKQ